jgi:hypothetical protein
MRRLLIIMAAVGVFSALGLAETYTGKLIDSSCLSKPKPTLASCQPSSDTTTFALVDDSMKVYKLDDAGNKKAANALKNRSDRSSDPNGAPKGASLVLAKITGTMNGNMITVDSIEVQ